MAVLQATVTSKGQVTLPKSLRESLSIRAGDKLEFTMEAANQISVRKKRKPGSSQGCAQKFLKKDHPPLTDDQIKEAIGQHFQRKFRQDS
jgi:antitoxin PrlF